MNAKISQLMLDPLSFLLVIFFYNRYEMKIAQHQKLVLKKGALF